MCTSIFLKTNGGGHVYARTMEFGAPTKSALVFFPRSFPFEGIGVDGNPGSGINWASKHAVIGTNGFGLPNLYDGMNEVGLAGGLLNAPNYAEYQHPTDGESCHSIAPQQLLLYVLSNFQTVGEVKEGLVTILVNSSPFKEWGGVPRCHMTLHDQDGQSIVVEYLKGQLVITDNPLGVMTNDPPIAWHLANLGNYGNICSPDAKPLTINGEVFSPSSSGQGTMGLPGSFLSSDRFVRASLYVSKAPTKVTTLEQINVAWHIMNNFDIPPGALPLISGGAYGGGVGGYETTEWTSVADIKGGSYYLRSYESQAMQLLSFKDFNLEEKEMKTFPLRIEPLLERMTS
jgi:choloylglycine hydrolase